MWGIEENYEKMFSEESCGYGECSDACGDEDNCCEYGCDRMPQFETVTALDLFA